MLNLLKKAFTIIIKYYIQIVTIIATAFLILPIILGWTMFKALINGNINSPNNFSSYGVIGDYFNGVSGPFLSFITFVIVILTFREQKEQGIKQNDITNKQDEIINRQMEIIEKQNKINEEQNKYLHKELDNHEIYSIRKKIADNIERTNKIISQSKFIEKVQGKTILSLYKMNFKDDYFNTEFNSINEYCKKISSLRGDSRYKLEKVIKNAKSLYDKIKEEEITKEEKYNSEKEQLLSELSIFIDSRKGIIEEIYKILYKSNIDILCDKFDTQAALEMLVSEIRSNITREEIFFVYLYELFENSFAYKERKNNFRIIIRTVKLLLCGTDEKYEHLYTLYETTITFLEGCENGI